ncbi:sporulation-induced protein [Fusarium falciforme]|nr:sporulation-induced protein [Fusarium falciforme]
MNITFENTEVMSSLFESKWIAYTEDVLEDLKGEALRAILGDIAEEGDMLQDEEEDARDDKGERTMGTVDALALMT